mmetsp:Transcript_86659/g.279877  ORF Transcript_86659/g.279877 Transcript_86659/m.279877 type:complete len:404 (-) Transcript_86659:4581-5792(-)
MSIRSDAADVAAGQVVPIAAIGPVPCASAAVEATQVGIARPPRVRSDQLPDLLPILVVVQARNPVSKRMAPKHGFIPSAFCPVEHKGFVVHKHANNELPNVTDVVEQVATVVFGGARGADVGLLDDAGVRDLALAGPRFVGHVSAACVSCRRRAFVEGVLALYPFVWLVGRRRGVHADRADVQHLPMVLRSQCGARRGGCRGGGRGGLRGAGLRRRGGRRGCRRGRRCARRGTRRLCHYAVVVVPHVAGPNLLSTIVTESSASGCVNIVRARQSPILLLGEVVDIPMLGRLLRHDREDSHVLPRRHRVEREVPWRGRDVAEAVQGERLGGIRAVLLVMHGNAKNRSGVTDEVISPDCFARSVVARQVLRHVGIVEVEGIDTLISGEQARNLGQLGGDVAIAPQ